MKPFALLALGLLLLISGGSTAAFVDEAETAAPATADHVTRWLGIAAPAAATCAAAPNTATAGSDETASIAVGGAAAASDPGRTVSCALVLQARTPLPEGAEGLTVRIARAGVAGDPVTGAALTTLDGTGAAGTATLGAGERRALQLTVRDGARTQSTVAITADVGDDATGFLRYDVPISVCERELEASCTAPGAGNSGDGGGSGGSGGSGETAPDAPAAAPAPPAPAPSVVGTSRSTGPATTGPRTCFSRRRFTIRLPRTRRDERYVGSSLTVNGTRRTSRRLRRSGRDVVVVDLRRRVRSSVRVVVTARTSTGRRIREVRRYRTCRPKPASGIAPKVKR